jgi:hypothetical protein
MNWACFFIGEGTNGMQRCGAAQQPVALAVLLGQHPNDNTTKGRPDGPTQRDIDLCCTGPSANAVLARICIVRAHSLLRRHGCYDLLAMEACLVTVSSRLGTTLHHGPLVLSTINNPRLLGHSDQRARSPGFPFSLASGGATWTKGP